MRKRLTDLIDFFYPPFRRWMPVLTFRYAVCGGGNTLMALLVYFLGYHYLFNKQVFDFGFYAMKPHIAALFLSGIFSFLLGFILNKFLVFTDSNLRGRVQLFRYFLSFFFNLILNYLLLKLMVEIIHLEAILSQLINTFIVVAVSYLMQRKFTFKVH